MGPLTLDRSTAPSWWAGVASWLCAAGAMVVVALVGDTRPGPLAVAAAAVVVHTVALAAGRPSFVVTSSCLQIGAVTWSVWLDDGGPNAGVVLVGLVVWASFELALVSFDVRGDVTVTDAVTLAWVTDLVGLAAVGGVVALVALALSGSGPTPEVLALRAGGLALVSGVLVGLLLLSRRARG